MSYSKEHLDKLVSLVDELVNDPENVEFKGKLAISLMTDSSKSDIIISEIYEYCINFIIKEQAVSFYNDFNISEIKARLIYDFIRMEKFRRENNFEDFCLALFQQVEAIVNSLLSDQVRQYCEVHINDITHRIKDKETNLYVPYKLWQLIFYPKLEPHEIRNKISRTILEWDFTERYKTVLYYYYFNKKIYNYHDFTSIYFLGDELYQSRNLNHRGGRRTEKQERTMEKVKNEYQKYYFKFLGFLEEFTSKINQNLRNVDSL